MTKYQGTCHCGAVKLEATLDLSVVTRCNCTVCTKTMYTSAQCKPEQFKLLAGEAELSTYQWGAKIGTRYFCKHCGVQLYCAGTLEELGGAFVSVNVSALEGVEVHELALKHWDGRHDNWYAGMRDTPWPIYRAAS